MHALFPQAAALTEDLIGAAMEVHRAVGPGLLESIYERCLTHELSLRSHEVIGQKLVRIVYKKLTFEEPLRFDLLVAGSVLIEVKAVERLLPIHKAQLMTYMKLLDVPIGLLLNFHEPVLKDGIARLLLPGANQP
jgi:GxxExxY protein